MMDDTDPFAAAHAMPQTEAVAESAAVDGTAPAEVPSVPAVPGQSAAVEKFKSCRWRATPES